MFDDVVRTLIRDCGLHVFGLSTEIFVFAGLHKAVIALDGVHEIVGVQTRIFGGFGQCFAVSKERRSFTVLGKPGVHFCWTHAVVLDAVAENLEGWFVHHEIELIAFGFRLDRYDRAPGAFFIDDAFAVLVDHDGSERKRVGVAG